MENPMKQKGLVPQTKENIMNLFDAVQNTMHFADYSVTFDPTCGGFPSAITLHLRNGKTQNILHNTKPWLHIEFGTGEIATPFLPEGYCPHMQQQEDRLLLEYWNIPWKTVQGKLLSDWYLNLSYECNADGVCFIDMTFTAIALPLPDLRHFQLRVPMDFGPASEVTYGYWQRLSDVTSSAIQAVNSFSRNQTEQCEVLLERCVVPLVAFQFGQQGKETKHIEWMMEGQNSVGTDPYNSSSKISWENGNPSLLYEFIEKPISHGDRPYQWRNQMGFVLGQTPKIRKKAPLRLYHYLDLYDRLPTIQQVRKMAAEGADTLVLHEGWRTDLQNGGVPYLPEQFAAMVAECHRLGIRVAPYIRGNEMSVREGLASWFHLSLQKNYDGLYADYGGPLHYVSKDENAPGGKFDFKGHYHKIKELRTQTIGTDGVFILHVGPFFAGSVLSMTDGYTAGEGEKGALLASRREHGYFSETALAPGALWTTAFPDYKTEKMLPYMANAGQFPHVSLGVQLKSSSLSNPREPGAVTFARPLWRLYGLMENERNLTFSNDLCDEAILCNRPDVGAALFTMEDGAKLVLLSNFQACEASCQVITSLLEGEHHPECWILKANGSACQAERFSQGSPWSMTLPQHGIGGFLLCPHNKKWQERLEKFQLPYPEQDEHDLAYFQKIEEMRTLRFDAQPSQTEYLKVSIPIIGLNWEDDVWWDLYDSFYTILITPENGQQTLLGYLGKNGLLQEPPTKELQLWPGQETPWIALHECLPLGKSMLELRSCHCGEDFYSFVEAELTQCPSIPGKKMSYFSELDADRARLTFAVHLAPPKPKV